MWRLLFLLSAILLAHTSAGAAGPWPRDRGEGFVSTTATLHRGTQTGHWQSEGGLYLEYGWRDRVTLGFDAMDTQYDYTHALGFLRWAVSPPDTRLKLAATVGAGAAQHAAGWGPALRLGFSVGRDAQLVRPGWWSVTSAFEMHAAQADPTIKLDATFGLHL